MNNKNQDVTNKKICLYQIHFESGNAKLLEDSKEYLDDIVGLMKEIEDITVVIHGHTDSDGDESYNLKLSEKRAKSVYKYIKSNGIKSNRLSYKGSGESMPLAPNNTKEGKAKNRRVEFEIRKK